MANLKIVGIASGIVAVIGAATAIGLDLPKIATQDDVTRVELRVTLLEKDVIEDQLDRLQLRLYQNLRQQEEYRTQGKASPEWLIKEQSDMESRKRRLERRLDGK